MNRYGKLIIIEKDVARKGYVICKCDCGNVKSIRKTSLTKKKQPTESCGCLHKAKVSLIGTSNIKQNSQEQINTNIAFNTNFQVIKTDKPPKNNTSGYKGVSFCKERDNWEVHINVHNKRKFLGRYKTLEEAIQVRKEAEEVYFQPLINQLMEIRV